MSDTRKYLRGKNKVDDNQVKDKALGTRSSDSQERNKKKLIEELEYINTLMYALKPNIYQTFFKKYTATMIKQYITDIRNETIEKEYLK